MVCFVVYAWVGNLIEFAFVVCLDAFGLLILYVLRSGLGLGLGLGLKLGLDFGW